MSHGTCAQVCFRCTRLRHSKGHRRHSGRKGRCQVKVFSQTAPLSSVRLAVPGQCTHEASTPGPSRNKVLSREDQPRSGSWSCALLAAPCLLQAGLPSQLSHVCGTMFLPPVGLPQAYVWCPKSCNLSWQSRRDTQRRLCFGQPCSGQHLWALQKCPCVLEARAWR